jgi:CDP-4-dehydro-6-deoxyglucose reductase, E1
MVDLDALRRTILSLTTEYYGAAFAHRVFLPGVSPVPVAGRVFDADDLAHLMDASLDFWLTTGRFAVQFELEFARTIRARHALLCNSGSSANLLAVTSLTSPKLGDRQLVPGDEVVTVAAGFPTTVNPIFMNNLVPVFLDVELGTYNVDSSQLEEAIGPRTRAIILAHTLGNPFNLDAVRDVARRYNLWLIEDNCDALGSTYDGRPTGTQGDLGTVSFYPAHHITMGEGGCVVTNSPVLKTLVESFRDWGRDCWCDPGKENTCGKRFCWQLGALPYGYDHKYTYSHIGYNLKATDMQAAVGVAQLKKLSDFVVVRKRNWALLRAGLEAYQDELILPQALPKSDPSWFGFAVTVRPGAPFTRNELVEHLESNRVATRMLFAGNLIRQPAYDGRTYRVIGDLRNSDLVMERTFWIGVYPGLTQEMITYVIEVFGRFFASVGRRSNRRAMILAPPEPASP